MIILIFALSLGNKNIENNMNLMIKQIFALVMVIVCLTACGDGTQKSTFTGQLFEEKSPLETGVFFVNGIDESWQRNIFTFNYFYNGGGVTMGDINNDGLTDLFFTGNDVSNKLYLNNGNMQFEDISLAALQSSVKWANSATMVDINNDGYLDIYVSNGGPNFEEGLLQNDFYINNKDNTFTNKAEELGVDDAGRSVKSVFFDYDKDGDLDLLVANQSLYAGSMVDWMDANIVATNPSSTEGRLRLYRNDGQSFTDITKEAGVDLPMFAEDIIVGDYDNDGDQDVYITNDFFLPDYYFINNGDGTFVEKSRDLLSHVPYSSKGGDAADINNDGVLDLAIMDITSDDYKEFSMQAQPLPGMYSVLINQRFVSQFPTNAIQMGNDLASFQEVSRLFGVQRTGYSWSSLLADFDNDGFKDLYVTNGLYNDFLDKDFKMVQKQFEQMENVAFNESVYNKFKESMSPLAQSNRIYQNSNGQKFIDKTLEWTNNKKSISQGAAYGDLDNDGDIDIVINNLQDTVSILENKSPAINYLQVVLKANKYAASQNAKIEVIQGNKTQRVDYVFSKGYNSGVQQRAHFGLGDDPIDSVIVYWPDGSLSESVNIQPNQILTISKENAIANNKSVAPVKAPFMEITDGIGLDVFVGERIWKDENYEAFLPYKYSYMGPSLAVGDVDGDGFDDFYIGGTAGFAGQIMTAVGNQFKPINNNVFILDKKYEDIGAAFVDVDNDGDLDLYVASGGGSDIVSGSNLTVDRLYLNSGNGFFTKSVANLPEINGSTKSITVFDANGDGYSDLFIGGRNVPGKYPLDANSYLLMNTNGRYRIQDISDIQKNLCGMITDVSAVDLDGDQKEELVIVGEWCTPQIFSFSNNKLNKVNSKSLDNMYAWWQSVAAVDIDNDGDQDLILGNIGENNNYNISTDRQVQSRYGDFDNNGVKENVLSQKINGKNIPIGGIEDYFKVLPNLKGKFENNTAYANATLEDIIGLENIDSSIVKSINTASSKILINKGNFKFEVSNLPYEAQWAPINSIVTDDYNNDGHQDLVVAGNMFDMLPGIITYDAGRGLFLQGDGQGGFTINNKLISSGLNISRDVRDVKPIKLGSRQKGLLIANNNDKVQMYLWRDDLYK